MKSDDLDFKTSYDIVITFTNGEIVKFINARLILPTDSQMVCIEENTGERVVAMVNSIAMIRCRERREE